MDKFIVREYLITDVLAYASDGTPILFTPIRELLREQQTSAGRLPVTVDVSAVLEAMRQELE